MVVFRGGAVYAQLRVCNGYRYLCALVPSLSLALGLARDVADFLPSAPPPTFHPPCM